jgi:hypothetical protein
MLLNPKMQVYVILFAFCYSLHQNKLIHLAHERGKGRFLTPMVHIQLPLYTETPHFLGKAYGSGGVRICWPELWLNLLL